MSISISGEPGKDPQTREIASRCPYPQSRASPEYKDTTREFFTMDAVVSEAEKAHALGAPDAREPPLPAKPDLAALMET